MWWDTRFGRFDPVGPIVALHVLALALLGATQRSAGVLVAAAGVMLVWRVGMGALAAGMVSSRRGGVLLVRGVGSLVLAGVLVVLDGGTESPLFFSMLIVVVWETVVSPLRRLIWLGPAAIVVYVGVILVVPDVTATSLVRLGVFILFVGLLAWARALSSHWQGELARTRELAAGLVEEAPTGFAVYEAGPLRCVFANEVATRFGLDTPAETALTTYGTPAAGGMLIDVLAGVAGSGEASPPSLYVTSSDGGVARFLRIGVSVRPEPAAVGLLIAHAEDVTAQVTVGEQHRRFLEAANHQFRTPLSPILGYADLLARGELAVDELPEAGAAIVEGAQRIEQLLDRIGTLLRVQRDRSWFRVGITVGELIDTFLIGVHPAFDSVLVVEGDRNLIIGCDPRPLSAAISELVDNGRRHGIPPVTLTARSATGRCVLRLSDQGAGPVIDPDTPLGNTWDLLAHPEVMPAEMGDRLGLTYAYTLSHAAGASLRFERNKTDWAFVFDVPIHRSSSLRNHATLTT